MTTDPFINPQRRRDWPKLSELQGFLVAIEAFSFELVRDRWADAGEIERARVRITVALPPLSERTMAVHIDGRNHLLPVAFGTPEAPVFLSSVNLMVGLRQRPGYPLIGRLHMAGSREPGARNWWEMIPPSAAERVEAEAAIREASC